MTMAVTKFAVSEAMLEVGDCRQRMKEWKKTGHVPSLIVADPHYNIGRNYDICQDDKPVAEYLQFTREWAAAAFDLLHKHGSMWVAIYPNLVSEVDCVMKSVGFTKRDHIIWGFTFGQNSKAGFTQAHTHWLYYTKAKTKYVFNADDLELRQPSMRQLLYKDARANPDGRLPDNVWVLNLNMIKDELPKDLNLWVESRVCGTFKERIKGADNQMPRAVIDRIVRFCSQPGDLVVDPFGGTFTTAETCLAHNRKFLGRDLSKAYCQRGVARLRSFISRPAAPAAKTKEKTRGKDRSTDDRSAGKRKNAAVQPAAHQQTGPVRRVGRTGKRA